MGAAVKQYQLLDGHEEITATTGELEKVGIIKAAHNPFNSPVWPVKKPDGTWRMKGEYWELNRSFLHCLQRTLLWWT